MIRDIGCSWRLLCIEKGLQSFRNTALSPGGDDSICLSWAQLFLMVVGGLWMHEDVLLQRCEVGLLPWNHFICEYFVVYLFSSGLVVVRVMCGPESLISAGVLRWHHNMRVRAPFLVKCCSLLRISYRKLRDFWLIPLIEGFGGDLMFIRKNFRLLLNLDLIHFVKVFTTYFPLKGGAVL